jgi:hypothetical protein
MIGTVKINRPAGNPERIQQTEQMGKRSIDMTAGIGALFLTTLIVAIFPRYLWAQDDEPSVVDNWSETLDIISFGAEFIASPGHGGYFEEYQKLGGSTSSLDPALAPTLGVRLKLSDYLRLVFFSSWIRSGFTELYEVYSPASLDPPVEPHVLAVVTDEFTVSAVPLMGGLEIRPVVSQFTSYVGLSAGLAFTSAEWTTEVRAISPSEFFRPESNVDGIGFSPALRLYAGMDLRFDRFFSGRSAFRGLYIEAAYVFLPVSRDYFTEIRPQARGVPEIPADDSATVLLGGLSITLGLNLQFLRQEVRQ